MAGVIGFLGYATFVYLAYRLFRALYNAFYPFFIASPADLHRLAGGKWAIVTGSTDGIGKSYAFELARKGFNLVLISRTLSKLEETKSEITKKYSGVTVKVVAFDFTSADLSAYEKTITSEIKGLDIGILGEYFMEISVIQILNIILGTVSIHIIFSQQRRIVL